MTPAIQLDRVTKIFPGAARPAVAELSLSVDPGDLVVLLGSSGSGKTTLLKMINRLYEPSGGEIYLNGVAARSMVVTELRRHIGYVIQQIGLFPHQSVAQNIATVPRVLGWERQRIANRVDFLLDLMHLPPDQYRHRRPRQLSGGQQQRVGIARALAGDPPILLMDEPFAALDAITRGMLQDELRRVQRQFHKTVLFVTHDVEEALKLADKIVVMEDGHMRQYGTSADLLAHPATDFVRELLNADDILRYLALLPVEDFMRSVAPGDPAGAEAGAESEAGAERLPAGSSLRQAVSRLLRQPGRPVLVTAADGKVIGQLSWAEIQAVTARAQHGEGKA